MSNSPTPQTSSLGFNHCPLLSFVCPQHFRPLVLLVFNFIYCMLLSLVLFFFAILYWPLFPHADTCCQNSCLKGVCHEICYLFFSWFKTHLSRCVHHTKESKNFAECIPLQSASHHGVTLRGMHHTAETDPALCITSRSQEHTKCLYWLKVLQTFVMPEDIKMKIMRSQIVQGIFFYKKTKFKDATTTKTQKHWHFPTSLTPWWASHCRVKWSKFIKKLCDVHQTAESSSTVYTVHQTAKSNCTPRSQNQNLG